MCGTQCSTERLVHEVSTDKFTNRRLKKEFCLVSMNSSGYIYLCLLSIILDFYITNPTNIQIYVKSGNMVSGVLRYQI